MKGAVLLAALLVASPAAAEVKSSSDAGFEIVYSVTVPAPPDKAYAAIVEPALWWNKAHSWSGDARNMTIDARAGGCFCEALPATKGSVEHGRVLFARPGVVLRLSGALGPLQNYPISGILTFEIKPSGSGSRIDVSYVVGGYVPAGIKPFAAPVDGVIGEQVARLGALLDTKP